MRARLAAFVALSALLAASVASAQDKLPGGVSFRLKEADRILQKAERALASPSVASEDWKIQTAQAGVDGANEKMAEIEKQFAGKYSPEHPDIVAMKARIAKLQAMTGQRADAVQQAADASRQQAAEAGQASAGWLARLRPYVLIPGRPGHDRDKYLIPSATQDQAEMEKRLAIYAEAAPALAEYRKANLSDKATAELQQVAGELDAALNDFIASCREYADAAVADADTRIRRMEEFARTQETRMAAKEEFLFLSRDEMGYAQSAMDRAAGLLKAGDVRLAGLKTRIDALKKADVKLRAARTAETRMKPDAYSGGDLAALKKSAEQYVLKGQPGMRILKTTVISPDWKEETVVEWTDSTQTALRRRTTRSLTAQVAGRKNADTLLHTVYVAQDRKSGGEWGPTYGHVMYTDPMLEANAK